MWVCQSNQIFPRDIFAETLGQQETYTPALGRKYVRPIDRNQSEMQV